MPVRRTIFCYGVPAVDLDFFSQKTVKQYIKELVVLGDDHYVSYGLSYSLFEFLEMNYRAIILATSIGYEHIHRRQEPVLFFVLDDYRFVPGFVFKNDNNGDTYVISPVELPHLGEPRVTQEFWEKS